MTSVLNQKNEKKKKKIEPVVLSREWKDWWEKTERNVLRIFTQKRY